MFAHENLHHGDVLPFYIPLTSYSARIVVIISNYMLLALWKANLISFPSCVFELNEKASVQNVILYLRSSSAFRKQ